jgi:hypothetical protein
MAYLIKQNAIIVRVLFSPGKPDIKGNQLEKSFNHVFHQNEGNFLNTKGMHQQHLHII